VRGAAPRPGPRAGVAEALAAALLFGLSAPVAKSLLGSVPPQLLAGLLYLGSGIGLATLWLVRGSRRTAVEAPLAGADLPWLAGAIACGGIIAPVLLLAGLARTAASTASLLLNLEAVFTALAAWVVVGENVDRRIAFGMACIVAGGVLVSRDPSAAWPGWTGSLLVAAACLAWAADNNLTRKVSAADPIQVAALKGLVAGGLNVALAIGRGERVVEPASAASALGLGFASYGVSLVLYLLALRSLGAARTGAYFSLAPFVGAALAVALWREPVTPALIGAALLMGLGLRLHLTERHEHRHEHEPLVHAHGHVHDEHHRHDHSPEDPRGEPHSHPHRHERLVHRHAHVPDLHHRHRHRL
jgi:drug/metabolite transporter (DMT)-like permease